jgi:hypothetical protein
LLAEDDQERTEVDLGSDVPVFPVEPGPGFPIFPHEELAVDKVLAVLAASRHMIPSTSWQSRINLGSNDSTDKHSQSMMGDISS